MSRQNRRATTVIVGLFIASLAASGATAAPPPSAGASALPAGASDISATANGKRLIAEATGRYVAKGFKAKALRAIKDGAGILIAPLGTTFETVSVTLADGKAGTALAPQTADIPAAVTAATTEVTALAVPTWSLNDGNCFSRISDTFAWLDHCYHRYRLVNDGNGVYDWWALKHFASMDANDPWVMNWAKIRAHRQPNTTAQTWWDWQPRSNWSGGSCGQITVGVTSPVAGIAVGVDRCPSRWDVTKSANGTSPDYSLQWTGFGTRDMREVAFEISVRVTQGAVAGFTLPAEVHGYIF